MSLLLRLTAGPTVQDKMTEYRNRSTGFDYLRLSLALGVSLWHAFYLCYGPAAADSPARLLVITVLPMFFTLSGFLVSGSLVRARTIHEFALLRAMRIVPALFVEVCLSAIILGGLFTTLSKGDYYSSPGFFAYFRNIYGDIHFTLPGVFKSNPVPVVNGSLWTIPFELECYLAIALLWLTGIIRHRMALLALTVAVHLIIPARGLWSGHFLHYDTKLPGRMLVVAFLYGVILYFFREKIVLRGWMFVVAAVATFGMAGFDYTSYLIVVPAAYMVVYLGLTNPPKVPIVMNGDYSYGIYLYSGPFQGAVAALFPTHRQWYVDLAGAVVPTAIMAAFSWHLVELPITRRRRALIAWSDRRVEQIKELVRPRRASPAAE